MANANGKKFGLTALSPIKPGHCEELRFRLRAMDSKPYGSPLSGVNTIHMARLAIINTLAFEGIPAKRDLLKSSYLLFMCDFDGATIDSLVAAMVANIPATINEIWGHCIAYPGLTSRDQLTAYFERCQLETNLFLADRPGDEVETILRGLLYKREFAKFVATHQNNGLAFTKADFLNWWQTLSGLPTPKPGSM
jgi:hypothetical protein